MKYGYFLLINLCSFFLYGVNPPDAMRLKQEQLKREILKYLHEASALGEDVNYDIQFDKLIGDLQETDYDLNTADFNGGLPLIACMYQIFAKFGTNYDTDPIENVLLEENISPTVRIEMPSAAAGAAETTHISMRAWLEAQQWDEEVKSFLMNDYIEYCKLYFQKRLEKIENELSEGKTNLHMAFSIVRNLISSYHSQNLPIDFNLIVSFVFNGIIFNHHIPFDSKTVFLDSFIHVIPLQNVFDFLTKLLLFSWSDQRIPDYLTFEESISPVRLPLLLGINRQSMNMITWLQSQEYDQETKKLLIDQYNNYCKLYFEKILSFLGEKIRTSNSAQIEKVLEKLIEFIHEYINNDIPANMEQLVSWLMLTHIVENKDLDTNQKIKFLKFILKHLPLSIKFRLESRWLATPLYIYSIQNNDEQLFFWVATRDMPLPMGTRSAFNGNLLDGACTSGNVKIIEYLISHGFDPNTPDTRGITPVQRAISAGNIRVVDYLLRQTIKPLTVHTIMGILVMLAMADKNKKEAYDLFVKIFLQNAGIQTDDPYEVIRKDTINPEIFLKCLMYSFVSKNSDFRIALFLLEHGFMVPSHTLSEYFTKNHHISSTVVEILLMFGYKLSNRDVRHPLFPIVGRLSLINAVTMGETNIDHVYRNAPPEERIIAFFIAIGQGNLDAVRYMLRDSSLRLAIAEPQRIRGTDISLSGLSLLEALLRQTDNPMRSAFVQLQHIFSLTMTENYEDFMRLLSNMNICALHHTTIEEMPAMHCLPPEIVDEIFRIRFGVSPAQMRTIRQPTVRVVDVLNELDGIIKDGDFQQFRRHLSILPTNLELYKILLERARLHLQSPLYRNRSGIRYIVHYLQPINFLTNNEPVQNYPTMLRQMADALLQTESSTNQQEILTLLEAFILDQDVTYIKKLLKVYKGDLAILLTLADHLLQSYSTMPQYRRIHAILESRLPVFCRTAAEEETLPATKKTYSESQKLIADLKARKSVDVQYIVAVLKNLIQLGDLESIKQIFDHFSPSFFELNELYLMAEGLREMCPRDERYLRVLNFLQNQRHTTTAAAGVEPRPFFPGGRPK